MPQKVRNEPYIPTDDDVRRILEHARGTEYEIPIILACYGLRRSEICALTLEDIDGDVVRITKAMVQDENFKWVIKTTKTTASTREIIIPEKTASQIRKRGYIYIKAIPEKSISFYIPQKKSWKSRIFPYISCDTTLRQK